AKVVNCSVIVPAWSDGEGGGAVHSELAKVIGSGGMPGDMLAVACAGNLAQRHWSGRFADGGAGYHRWAPGRIDNVLTPWHDEPVSVELCCKPGASYTLEVFDAARPKPVGVPQLYRAVDRT